MCQRSFPLTVYLASVFLVVVQREQLKQLDNFIR